MDRFTRRSLVKGGAALGGVAALGASGLGEWAKAWAQASPFKPEAGASLNIMRWRRFVEAEGCRVQPHRGAPSRRPPASRSP